MKKVFVIFLIIFGLFLGLFMTSDTAKADVADQLVTINSPAPGSVWQMAGQILFQGFMGAATCYNVGPAITFSLYAETISGTKSFTQFGTFTSGSTEGSEFSQYLNFPVNTYTGTDYVNHILTYLYASGEAVLAAISDIQVYITP